jgi:hypothetical protein
MEKRLEEHERHIRAVQDPAVANYEADEAVQLCTSKHVSEKVSESIISSTESKRRRMR